MCSFHGELLLVLPFDHALGELDSDDFVAAQCLVSPVIILRFALLLFPPFTTLGGMECGQLVNFVHIICWK